MSAQLYELKARIAAFEASLAVMEIKHLQGKHDQKDHGRGTGGGGKGSGGGGKIVQQYNIGGAKQGSRLEIRDTGDGLVGTLTSNKTGKVIAELSGDKQSLKRDLHDIATGKKPPPPKGSKAHPKGQPLKIPPNFPKKLAGSDAGGVRIKTNAEGTVSEVPIKAPDGQKVVANVRTGMTKNEVGGKQIVTTTYYDVHMPTKKNKDGALLEISRSNFGPFSTTWYSKGGGHSDSMEGLLTSAYERR